MATQRARRQDAVVNLDAKEIAKIGMSPLAITPGTPLMRKIRDSLEYYAASRLESKLSSTSMLISGSEVYGEGELKMLDVMIAQATGEMKASESYPPEP